MTKLRARHRPQRSDGFEPGEREALIKAILNLPRDPRDVFLLHRMAHMPYEQIGARLDMALDEVQAHLVTALGLLGQTLAGAKRD